MSEKLPPTEKGISLLKDAIRHSWSKDTARGEWNKDVPSLNQCAVTALVVHSFFGGSIMRAEMTDGDSHYWNVLPDGTTLDFTEDQFILIDGRPIPGTEEKRSEKYLLSDNDTFMRYNMLMMNTLKYFSAMLLEIIKELIDEIDE